MEPEQTPEEVLSEKQPSIWNTVTPLSKYLAMTLFVALPFIGGWVGYMYAPEKVVEIERVVEVEIEDIEGENNLVAQNEFVQVGDTIDFFGLGTRDENSSYVVSEASLIQQGFLNPESDRYFGYYAEQVTKLNDKFVILGISLNPAGMTNLYLVDESERKVIREIDMPYNQYESVSTWFTLYNGGSYTTYQAIINGSEVKIIDYINDTSEIVYTETDEQLSFFESCEVFCNGNVNHSGVSGNLLVSRYDIEVQRNQQGHFWRNYHDTIEIVLPDKYKHSYQN